jgi:argininosuccinate lyase
MPHKKNPDVFELIRGKCNKIQALPYEITLITTTYQVVTIEFTIIERRLVSSHSKLTSLLDIAIFHQRHKSKDNILADKNTTICLQ